MVDVKSWEPAIIKTSILMDELMSLPTSEGKIKKEHLVAEERTDKEDQVAEERTGEENLVAEDRTLHEDPGKFALSWRMMS